MLKLACAKADMAPTTEVDVALRHPRAIFSHRVTRSLAFGTTRKANEPSGFLGHHPNPLTIRELLRGSTQREMHLPRVDRACHDDDEKPEKPAVKHKGKPQVKHEQPDENTEDIDMKRRIAK